MTAPDREARRLRAEVRRLQRREDERASRDFALAWLIAPFGVLVVLVGAGLRACASAFDRWLERREAARYHRRRTRRANGES